MTDLAQQIKALAEKATEGPWGFTPMVPLATNYFYLVGNRDGNNAEVDLGSIGPSLAPSTEANAALIVLLRNNVDQILTALSEAERMREALPMAIAKALYGPDFDPFKNPEAFDFCETASRAAIGGE